MNDEYEVPKTCAVVVKLRPDQYRSIRESSARDERSMAAWVRLAIQSRLEAESKQRPVLIG